MKAPHEGWQDGQAGGWHRDQINVDQPEDGLVPSCCPPVSSPGAGQPRHLWDWREAGGRGQEAGRRQEGEGGKLGDSG